MIEGMDRLLRRFNKNPNDKEFTVEYIINISNEVYEEILKENWHFGKNKRYQDEISLIPFYYEIKGNFYYQIVTLNISFLVLNVNIKPPYSKWGL